AMVHDRSMVGWLAAVRGARARQERARAVPDRGDAGDERHRAVPAPRLLVHQFARPAQRGPRGGAPAGAARAAQGTGAHDWARVTAAARRRAAPGTRRSVRLDPVAS